MKIRSDKSIFIAGAAILMVLVMAFSYMLNITALKNNFSESVRSTYTVTAQESVRIIEYSIKYGKSLNSFFGMDEILSAILSKHETVVDAYVFDTHGKLLYRQARAGFLDAAVTDEQRASLFKENPGFKNRNLDMESGYHLLIPVIGKSGVPEGGFGLTLDNHQLKKQIQHFVENTLKTVALITAVGILLMVVLLSPNKELDVQNRLGRRWLLTRMIIVLLVTQGSYAGYNLYTLNEVYRSMAIADAAVVRDIVAENTNRLIHVGLNLEDLSGIEKWMHSMVGDLPEIRNIVVEDPSGNSVYTAASKGEAVSADGFSVRQNLMRGNALVGSIHVLVSKEYIRQKLANTFLDSLSVLVASILVYIEISLLMVYALNRRARSVRSEETEPNEESGMIRALAFLFLFGTDLSLSFVPILSRQIVESSALGMPVNLAVALPIQAEMLATSVMALLTGILIDRKGWKPPFLAGIAVVAAGSLLCGISSSFIAFTAARACVGIGYGLSWTSLTGYVGGFKNDDTRRRGFADLIAGIYAGSNCGVVTGAMLAERLTYRPVFFVAVVFVMVSGVMGYLMVRNTAAHHTESHSEYTVVRFLKNGTVLRYLLLISVPGMCVLMFLNYYIPLYSQEIALSQSNLGRLFLLYGLSIIYLGPYLTEKLGKWMSSRQMLITAALLVSLSLLAFSMTGTLLVLVLTVIFFSVADSYGMTANTAYFVELDAARRLGRGKSIGILNTVRKFGMMLGPYAFGLAFIFPRNSVLMSIGGTYLVLILLFLMLSRKTEAAEA